MTVAGEQLVQVSPHLLVLGVALLGSGIAMVPAEQAVFSDEGDVRLGKRPIERTILASDDIVGNKTPRVHVGDNLGAFRAVLEKFKERHLQDDELGVAQRLFGSCQHVKLGPLDIYLEEKRT
jgi:hypothetical protein